MSENQENIIQGTEKPLESDVTNLDVKTPEVVTETPQQVSKSFLDSLSKELQDIPTLKKFKDVESLAKSYVNAQQLLGKKLEQLTPVELKSVIGRSLQAPESPDGYDVIGKDENSTAFFKNLAHELQLNPKQAKELVDKFNQVDEDNKKQSEITLVEQRRKLEEDLKRDWGKLFERNKKLAGDAIIEFGGTELAEALDAAGLGNNVQVLKAFSKIGETFLESDFVGETGLGQFGMSPEQAGHKIEELKRSKEFMDAFFNRRNPGHQAAVEDMYKLKRINKSLD